MKNDRARILPAGGVGSQGGFPVLLLTLFLQLLVHETVQQNVVHLLQQLEFHAMLPVLAAVFLRRFFAQQWKRSVMPDGPKVGSVSLSPRGDWRMPSDADASAWLRDLEG